MYALVDAKRNGGLYPIRRCRRKLGACQHEEPRLGPRRRFAGVRVDPRTQDSILRRQHLHLSLARWRQDSSRRSKALRAATIITPSGSIRTTPTSSCSALDQGATITVNGGQTWSSWYNQPTAQFYHVITDNRFPYWVYGGQQESGSVGIASRGDDGAITLSRLASGRRRRVWLRRARSPQSRT